MNYPIDNGSIILCSAFLNAPSNAGVYKCAILRDEFITKYFKSGEADNNRNAFIFEYLNNNHDQYPCLVRGSIKIDGMEYGVFSMDGNKATLRLKPTLWRDALVELEYAECKRLK